MYIQNWLNIRWAADTGARMAGGRARAGDARARAGEGGLTVDHRHLKSVERSIDMVIFFHNRLATSHIKLT